MLNHSSTALRLGSPGTAAGPTRELLQSTGSCIDLAPPDAVDTRGKMTRHIVWLQDHERICLLEGAQQSLLIPGDQIARAE